MTKTVIQIENMYIKNPASVPIGTKFIVSMPKNRSSSEVSEGDLIEMVKFDPSSKYMHFKKLKGNNTKEKVFVINVYILLTRVNKLNPKDFYKGGF